MALDMFPQSLSVSNFHLLIMSDTSDDECMTLSAKMAVAQPQYAGIHNARIMTNMTRTGKMAAIKKSRT